MEKILIPAPLRFTWKEVEETMESIEAKQKTKEDEAFSFLEMFLNLRKKEE